MTSSISHFNDSSLFSPFFKLNRNLYDHCSRWSHSILDCGKKTCRILNEFNGSMRGRIDLVNVLSANLSMLSLLPIFKGVFGPSIAVLGCHKSLHYFVGIFNQNPDSPMNMSKVFLLLGGLCFTGGYFHKQSVWKLSLFTRSSLLIGSIPCFKIGGNVIRVDQMPLLNLIGNSPAEFFFCLAAIVGVSNWVKTTYQSLSNETEEGNEKFAEQMRWDSLLLLISTIGRVIVLGHLLSNKPAVITINMIRQNASFIVIFANKWNKLE